MRLLVRVALPLHVRTKIFANQSDLGSMLPQRRTRESDFGSFGSRILTRPKARGDVQGSKWIDHTQYTRVGWRTQSPPRMRCTGHAFARGSETFRMSIPYETCRSHFETSCTFGPHSDRTVVSGLPVGTTTATQALRTYFLHSNAPFPM